MPPNDQQTGSPAPKETDTPSATPPSGGESATGDDEVVTIKKSDLNNIISARDRNAEQLRQNSAQDAFLMELAVERTVNKFLADNKDKFPDVVLDDLLHVDDPDNLEAVATRIQDSISKKVQAKLESVQLKEVPRLTEQQKTDKLNELRGDKTKRHKFGAFLRIQRS